MGSVVQVTYALQLNREAIQEFPLAWWIGALRIDSLDPTWDHVYRELTRVLIGQPQYKNFSQTAILDAERFTKLKLYETVEVELSKPVEIKPPAQKVAASPPPPPPVKRSNGTKKA